jgi:uroporphyrin-III C-methyltransferase
MAMRTGPQFAPGSVWLVGAGPGDPGLLTLHAARALEVADVVLHDALVSPEILALAGPGARLEAVGKRAGRPSPRQLAINARLIALARAGLKVVRLKGGDPLVFGRGGEEALALAAAGIPFRIVPGVTAGIGAAACAGIPLTHRTLAPAVTLVTGSGAAGRPPSGLDWRALATASPVLALYMALARIEAISGELLAAGRDPAEPVALVSDGTTADQCVRLTTLAGLAAAARDVPPGRPTLILIGPTVALHSFLAAWQQPLVEPAAPLAPSLPAAG